MGQLGDIRFNKGDNMKALVTIIVIALAVVFIVGAVSGHYNCIGYLSDTLVGAVRFVADVLKTEIHGFTIVAGLWG
jgi:hypothetical protein